MRCELDDALIARVRADLAQAAALVTPHPQTVERAVTGSRRRLARRRRTLTLSLTVLTVVSASVVSFGPQAVHVWGNRDAASTRRVTTDAHSALLSRTPGGDLISNSTYTGEVLQTWQDSHRTSQNRDRGIFDDLRGPARVVWAGSTRSGRGAVVVQQAYLHPHDNLSTDDTDQLRTLIGFIGTDQQGRPRVVADDYSPIGGPSIGAWFIDPGRTVLAAIDPGSAIGFGTDWTYGADGARTMNFTPMTVRDGVATQKLPAGTDSLKVRVSRLPCTGPQDAIPVAGSDAGYPPRTKSLDWTGTWQIAGTGHVAGNDKGQLLDVFRQALDAETTGVPQWGGSGMWLAVDTLPDGRRILVGDALLELDPFHSYAVLTGAQGTSVVHGGVVDPQSPLPIVIRLPDGAGWVVVRVSATLRWRSGPSGQWHAAGRDAALLPAEAAQVEVTPVRGAAHVVTLPGG